MEKPKFHREGNDLIVEHPHSNMKTIYRGTIPGGEAFVTGRSNALTWALEHPAKVRRIEEATR